ncbi:MAG: rubrerythrin [Candidatus Eisenbacteria bacterium]|nr:rubrerythrin [Candidatus Eisenbacteria bacterium]
MAEHFQSVGEILDFAIQREEEAAQFYADLSRRVERGAMKELFNEFAQEERRHKAKLQEVRRGNLSLSPTQNVQNLKIADYMADVDASLGHDFDYQKVLIVAMQREKKAFKLYSDLARMTGDEKVRELLLGLANEEAKHKLYFETEYDNHIMTEN